MGSIPDNYVEIEVEIDENGNFTRKIVGHGSNTGCAMEKDDEVMEDVLSELGEIGDYDHTDEYYEEKHNPITVRPMKNNCQNSIPQKDVKDKITFGFGT